MVSVLKKKKPESMSLKTFRKWALSEDFNVETDEGDNIFKIACKIKLCSEHYTLELYTCSLYKTGAWFNCISSPVDKLYN